MREKAKEVRNAVASPPAAIPIYTTGEFFTDGCIIEPVRDAADADRLTLLFWDGARSTVGPRVEHAGRIYEPAPIEPSVLRALTLPRNTAPYGSARELLAAISRVVPEYTGLAEQSVAKVGRVVLGSWLLGGTPTAPRLSLVGPDTIAGVQLLQVLRSLCRHALLLAEVTSPACAPFPWRGG